MIAVDDIKDKAGVLLAGLFGGGFWIAIFLGQPITFVYLIMEDAQWHHSFFGWVWIVNLDAFAAAIWPFYWISRLIFGG